MTKSTTIKTAFNQPPERKSSLIRVVRSSLPTVYKRVCFLKLIGMETRSLLSQMLDILSISRTKKNNQLAPKFSDNTIDLPLQRNESLLFHKYIYEESNHGLSFDRGKNSRSNQFSNHIFLVKYICECRWNYVINRTKLKLRFLITVFKLILTVAFVL